MAFNYSPKIVTNGLVLYLDAANQSSYVSGSTAWNDLTRNGNNGTLTNGPTFSSANSGIIVLDGVDDFINGVNNSQVDLTGSMTVECWFRLTNTRADWVRVFGKGDSTNRTFGLWYNQTNSTFLYQRYGTTNMNAQYDATVSLNTWYHMVGTSSGSSHVLYLNSVQRATSNMGTTFYSSTDPYKVGYGNIHTYHVGNVSNCRLYNRALTATEVQQNYNTLKGRFGL